MNVKTKKGQHVITTDEGDYRSQITASMFTQNEAMKVYEWAEQTGAARPGSPGGGHETAFREKFGFPEKFPL